ncbi:MULTISPECIES: hypothetical protein [Kitasatospora]|uniref:Uncharacterized protein n=1 Tax=Kitasatospora griseola TaxID=2064 RepID=A0A0D0PXV1_KITGR|nr:MULTISPECIES: hypothetical protein [Kitasatospora]KIQ63443.1 hypothetical protein TR51_32835 [Kitasatospora griseola]PJN22570.1 hypothetical protein CG736_26915 [Kitasatospora sp. CB02891]GGQ94464.1 hypothetical protein GCM10010195_57890 [Kitasatospora griseola]
MSTPVNVTQLAADLALDETKVTPGLLGFVVFAVLGIATWFLLKSMNARFKKIDFTEQPDPKDE